MGDEQFVTKKEYSTRQTLLDKAAQTVNVDRAVTHGAPERSFETIAAYWRTHLQARFGVDLKLTAADATVMMGLLKTARLANNMQHEDNWIDLMGYGACGGELALNTPKEMYEP